MQVALENAQAERVQKGPATSFTVAPLTPTIGAEIGQIDLAVPLDEASLHALRATLLTWKVIFFRDQDITTEQHLAFARQFGPLEIHPFSACKPGYPEVLNIAHGPKNRGAENVWHTDVTWRIEPSIGSILRAIEVPPVGGDTLFADMYAAYEELPDNVKAELEGKRARHTMGFYDGVMRKRGASQAEMDALYAKYPPTDHPLVRTHPETGRKALYLHPSFIQEVIGMAPEESKRLLKFLFRRSTTPEYQCRFRWQKNSIAFWDNRCSQHYAVSDYWPDVRRMERVTIAGDRPY